MIKQLPHHQLPVAEMIYHVFQTSYSIEAALIGEDDFPPLRRTAKDIQKSDTSFYGYWQGESLAGVVEICHGDHLTDIWSLVVAPAFFRQGIASSLLRFSIDAFPPQMAIVETATANAPAIRLYQKLGFREEKRWMTSIGIEKVKFRLRA